MPAAAEPRAEAPTEPRAAAGEPASLDLEREVSRLEMRLIDEALARGEGSKPKAAALLGISERALWYKLKKYRPREA